MAQGKVTPVYSITQCATTCAEVISNVNIQSRSKAPILNLSLISSTLNTEWGGILIGLIDVRSTGSLNCLKENIVPITWKDPAASRTALSINSSEIFREGCSLNTEFIRAILAALLLASAFVGQC